MGWLVFLLGAISNRIRGTAGTFGRIANALLFGLVLSYQHNINPAYISVAMLIGASFGWGAYIGAMIHKRIEPEVYFIDKLLVGFKYNPMLYGFAGLTLRGLVFGLPIFLVFHSIVPLLAGGLMGLVYFLIIKLVDKIVGYPDYGWAISEAIFGGLFWLICWGII
jgi:hypothetical protein